ncbi:hypothetical protein XENOCAPTIV_009239 [Xenoophorus captivus]|uniref:Tetratricopeptide repeat protein 9C n=1 Tax=Xenoophorus captivus TaxID=1517983 RepID=A0ABV0SAG2_9TELE
MEAVGTDDNPDAQGAVVEEPCPAGQSKTSAKTGWALLEEAVQLKTKGNAFYKEKNIRSAIGHYHRALLVLRGLDSNVLALVKGWGDACMFKALMCLLACLLQKQKVDYTRVLEYSLRVLQWQPGNIKALYRAGVANLEMGDAQAAKQYLTQVCREQPKGMDGARV